MERSMKQGFVRKILRGAGIALGYIDPPNPPKTFWQRWKKRTKERLLELLGIMGILLVATAILPEWALERAFQILEWVIWAVVAAFGVYFVYAQYELYRFRKRHGAELELQRQEAEEWKRRIRAAADSTEMKGHKIGFAEMCEWEEEEVLQQILVELDSMPRGQRSVAKAYSIALKKTDIPPFGSTSVS